MIIITLADQCGFASWWKSIVHEERDISLISKDLNFEKSGKYEFDMPKHRNRNSWRYISMTITLLQKNISSPLSNLTLSPSSPSHPLPIPQPSPNAPPSTLPSTPPPPLLPSPHPIPTHPTTRSLHSLNSLSPQPPPACIPTQPNPNQLHPPNSTSIPSSHLYPTSIPPLSPVFLFSHSPHIFPSHPIPYHPIHPFPPIPCTPHLPPSPPLHIPPSATNSQPQNYPAKRSKISILDGRGGQGVRLIDKFDWTGRR